MCPTTIAREKHTMSKCQRTDEFTRKLSTLLYYVHANMYNRIKCNCPRVIRRFSASLNVRVYDSDHPVTYVRKFCTNKTGRKIYRCIPARSTQHHMLLNNLTILHTKKVFVPACHPLKKISSKTNCHSLHCYTNARLTCHRPLQNTIQTHIQVLRTHFIF